MVRNLKRSKLGFWLFLLPCLATFLIVVIIPMFIGFGYSLTDWNGIADVPSFIGFTNFSKIFSGDTQFWNSFGFTAAFAACAVICINVVGFSLALLVTKKFKGANGMRSIFFMPNLIGGLMLGFAWQFIFINVFSATGIPLLEGWLTNSVTGFLGLLILMTWQMGGYMMLIYIAALQQIPQSVIEAAAIDGASGGKRLFGITVPMVAPAFTIGMFLTLSNCFKLYDQNLALTAGGPNNSTQMIALNIYQTAFNLNDFGVAQAKAVIFFVAVAIIAGLQLYLSKRKEVEM